MSRSKNIGNDLFYFFGDDYEKATPNQIFKIITYTLQSYDTVEEVFLYLDSIIEREAINFKLISNGDKAGILRFFNKIEYFLDKVQFVDKKAFLKNEIKLQLRRIDEAHYDNIVNEMETPLFVKYSDMLDRITEINTLTESESTNEKGLLTITEVAEKLKVTPQSIYNWIKEGRIKPTRISEKRQRISNEEVNRFLGT